MVTIIRMRRKFGDTKLTFAVQQALNLGCEDVAAGRHPLTSDQLEQIVAEPVEISKLIT
jgi:hypothetical protein